MKTSVSGFQRVLAGLLLVFLSAVLCGEDMPDIANVRVDPEIVMRLKALLSESELVKLSNTDVQETAMKDIFSFATPTGYDLRNRYTNLGITLAEALAGVTDPDIKVRLTEAARWAHSPNVRSVALVSMAFLKNRDDLKYFREALWDNRVMVRFAALEALQAWGYPEGSVPVLTKVAQSDPSPLLKVYAAQILYRYGDPTGRQLLLNYLKDRDWVVRAMAGRYIGELGTAEDYDMLVARISAEQDNDFVAAEMAIGALNLYPQKKLKMTMQQLDSNSSRPGSPGRKRTKRDVVMELEPLVVRAPRMKVPRGEWVAPQIDALLIRMMEKYEQKDFIGPTDDQLLQPARADVIQLVTPAGFRLKSRYSELGILLTDGVAGTNESRLVDQLMRTVRSGINQNVRSAALVALGYRRDRADMPFFMENVRHENISIRFATAEALTVWGFRDAASLLRDMAQTDSSGAVRVFAAQGMWRVGDEGGKEILWQFLDYSDWVVRAMAVRYIGELGGADDYNRMLYYLGREQNKFVQAEICSALLKLYQ
ncbi:MAG TPA: HEAT repeat domain-containing protein [Elusimicrobiota bacterium]|nr:HEAT repeat domain-containing protein [Elusimicrobiota bacterium]